MEREQILLKEYEVCQSDNNAKGNQSWISFSIIITVNLLLLGQVVSNLIMTSSPDAGYSKLIFVIIISLIMITILLLFKQWDKRVSFHIRLNHRRMREIEELIKVEKGEWLLQKKWSERSLDIHYDPKEKEKIPDDFKLILDKLREYYPICGKPKGENFQTKYISSVTKDWGNFRYIFLLLIGLWASTMVIEILIYCPFAYNWLLN